MIINKNTNPQRDLYYLGALLIEVLNNNPNNYIDFFDAFQLLKEKEKISINLFVLTIDWLFILGVVKSQKGVIEKCF